MNFNFNIGKALGNVGRDGFGFLDGENTERYSKQDYEFICQLLDEIGLLSAKVTLNLTNNA